MKLSYIYNAVLILLWTQCGFRLQQYLVYILNIKSQWCNYLQNFLILKDMNDNFILVSHLKWNCQRYEYQKLSASSQQAVTLEVKASKLSKIVYWAKQNGTLRWSCHKYSIDFALSTMWIQIATVLGIYLKNHSDVIICRCYKKVSNKV